VEWQPIGPAGWKPIGEVAQWALVVGVWQPDGWGPGREAVWWACGAGVWRACWVGAWLNCAQQAYGSSGLSVLLVNRGVKKPSMS
jgi:hypothetical protein